MWATSRAAHIREPATSLTGQNPKSVSREARKLGSLEARWPLVFAVFCLVVVGGQEERNFSPVKGMRHSDCPGFGPG